MDRGVARAFPRDPCSMRAVNSFQAEGIAARMDALCSGVSDITFVVGGIGRRECSGVTSQTIVGIRQNHAAAQSGARGYSRAHLSAFKISRGELYYK